MQMRRAIFQVCCLSGAVAIAGGAAAQSTFQAREPAYVRALLDGQADRLASPNVLQWNTEIADFKRETGSTFSDEMIDQFLRVRREGSPPDLSKGPEAERAWKQRLSRWLDSSYVRMLIFRHHYFVSFAQRLDGKCAFLTPAQKADVAAALEQAVSAFRIGQRTKSEIDALAADEKLAFQTMSGSLSNGHNDADALARAAACNAPSIKTVTATLLKLLSPRQEGGSAAVQARYVRERKATIKQTGDFLVGETLLRTGPEQSWFATAFIATPKLATLRIPGVDEEVAGKTIGWFTDASFAEALDGDSRPIMFVSMGATADCHQCRTLMQDLLVSEPFNRLAGRVAAVLLVANSDPDSFVSRMRKSLDTVAVPDIMVLQRATAAAPARMLYRLERVASAAEIAQQISQSLPASLPVAPPKTPHKPFLAPPDVCWLAETLELCQARLRRDVHLE